MKTILDNVLYEWEKASNGEIVVTSAVAENSRPIPLSEINLNQIKQLVTTEHPVTCRQK